MVPYYRWPPSADWRYKRLQQSLKVFWDHASRTMATKPDGPRTSEQTLSEIAGIQAPLRQQWANKGRLRKRGRQGYEELDAVELGVLRALMDALGTSDGPIAWSQLRDSIPERADERHLFAVFDQQTKLAALATTVEELERFDLQSAKTRMVALANTIQTIRHAFDLVTREV